MLWNTFWFEIKTFYDVDPQNSGFPFSHSVHAILVTLFLSLSLDLEGNHISFSLCMELSTDVCIYTSLILFKSKLR